MSATATTIQSNAASTSSARDLEAQAASGRQRLGMWLFIVADAILFFALFLQYFFARARVGAWPPSQGMPSGFSGVPVAPIPLILTGVMLVSALTAHLARSAASRGDSDTLQGWLIITALLGLGFVGAQAFQFSLLAGQKLTFGSGVYGSFFYGLNALHWLQAIAGVVVLAAVLVRAFLGHFTTRSHFAVQGAVLFWQLLVVVWLALFVFVYVI